MERLLDEVAEQPNPKVGTQDSDLDAYVAALMHGKTGGGSDPDIVLRLSAEMASSWSQSATDENSAIDEWVASNLARMPAQAIDWEIAAAARALTLAEWAYASALSAPASLALPSA